MARKTMDVFGWKRKATRLQNKLKKAVKALEFLQDAAENCLTEGCDVCGNTIDVYEFGEGGSLHPDTLNEEAEWARENLRTRA